VKRLEGHVQHVAKIEASRVQKFFENASFQLFGHNLIFTELIQGQVDSVLNDNITYEINRRNIIC
jgi:hypothetical protein